MDPKKLRRPKLERRNAAKHIDYDATSFSSHSEEDPSSSLVTRSLNLHDRTSFRIQGTEGEFELIFRSLGLNGPEDFAIPADDWEAMNRSASDLLPLSRFHENDGAVADEISNGHELQDESAHSAVAGVLDRVRIRDGTAFVREDSAETAELNGYSGGSSEEIRGIRGVRPPLLKPPPSRSLPSIPDARSTWDLMRDFGPESGSPSLVEIDRDLSSDDEERYEEEVGMDGSREPLGVADENLSSIREAESGVLSDSGSFAISNDDDSSSITTEPMSNISPNGPFTRIITEWEKGDLLGRGSFGSVYEGISHDGFFFAIKEVSLLDQGSQAKQKVQEIDLLSQFEHENIVQYYGTDKDESNLYIFLELVTKGSLMSLYQRYDLRDSQVSAYTRQILHGLKYLHDRNVVHRDIKCANILVDANGSVKLADFGLAKATKLNDVKSMKGTASWMAPEVVNRKNQGYGLPADIWSLGCTVLEMLTHRIPYSDLEPMQALFRIGRGVPPTVPESLSEDARDFIVQCLQVKADGRPTAARLLDHPFVQRPLQTSSLGSASPHLPRRRH
ncbi:Mitogen-activated protein kinase kinase kinase 1 [Linum perenne]